MQGRTKTIWVQERPARWGNTWALGCSVCADFVLRKAAGEHMATSSSASTPGAGRHKRSCTIWARCEARPLHLQSEHLRQHQLSDAHKIAVANFIRPDAPLQISLQETFEDDQLLALAVPQPADWLRAWRVTQDPSSWESAGNAASTEHFIAQIRARVVQPRSFKAMVLCMAEVNRCKKRALLKQASAIFLSFDDNGRKLLRCKVDSPGCIDSPSCLDALDA